MKRFLDRWAARRLLKIYMEEIEDAKTANELAIEAFLFHVHGDDEFALFLLVEQKKLLRGMPGKSTRVDQTLIV